MPNWADGLLCRMVLLQPVTTRLFEGRSRRAPGAPGHEKINRTQESSFTM
jgi:hypothetical protein